MKRTRWALLALVAVTATACPPPETPGPASPTWTATRLARSVVGDVDPFVHIDSWTNDDWFATTTLSGNFVSTVQFRPRSGAGGATLGSPQLVSPFIQGVRFLPGADPDGQLLGLRGFQNGAPAIEFLRETGGTWSIVGTSPLAQTAVAMNDRWLITRNDPLIDGNPATVSVYSIDASGPTVTISFVQTLAPDPAWPSGQASAFGDSLALDGDLLVATVPVVGVASAGTQRAGAARIFRSNGTTWAPVQTLDGAAAGRARFGYEIGADDGASVDRIALSTTSFAGESEYGPTSIDVYVDHGTGFALEQTLVPDPADTDINDGSYFGYTLAIDGDLIAAASRIVKVPSAVAGHAEGNGGFVKVFRRGASAWTEEAELATHVSPLPAGFGVMRPTELKASGDHVAVVTFAPEQECGFGPCIDFSFEAWSLDRTG